MYFKIFFSFCVVGLGAVCAAQQNNGSESEGKVTLLGVLAEWQYPGAEFGGASISDGGSLPIRAVKCQALLTTGDTVEQVEQFYSEKFGPHVDLKTINGEPEIKKVPGQSFSVQDDSEGRPLELRVIVVNRADTSTTLVISRANGEQKTHIAWSHFLRFHSTR